MRKMTFVYLLLFTVQAFAGTYETVDGNRNRLKKIDGTPHKRSGDLGPGQNLRWAGLQEADLRESKFVFYGPSETRILRTRTLPRLISMARQSVEHRYAMQI